MAKPALAIAALLLLAAPAAAHTSVFSDDGKYRVVVGLLNEPVVTYSKSGLDICFQLNNTARTPLKTVNPGGLTATLIAPGGETLTMPLRSQFGRDGCFQFQDPVVPTAPGQYVVDLAGDLNGTEVSFEDVAAGGPVDDQADVTFPDRDVAALTGLAAENAALRSDVEALRARLDASEARVAALEEGHEEGSEGIPATALLPLALVAAAVVAMRRRAH